MTLSQAISRGDALADNQIPFGQKVAWLSHLDGTIHREILETHAQTAGRAFSGYGGDAAPDTELLTPFPYDELYPWYLETRIHEAHGETRRYNDAVQKYNAALLSYCDFVNRSATPLGRQAVALV